MEVVLAPGDIDHLFPSRPPSAVPMPLMRRVKQHFNLGVLDDPVQQLQAEVRSDRLWSRIPEGGEVCVAVGSREIPGLSDLVRALVELIRARGAKPFVVPAMGSHGGATAEGQRQLLSRYGITEAEVGAPIRSTTETVPLGEVRPGVPLYMDRYAYNAGGIVVLNRIKPHTAFHGLLESGVGKMLVIGLGKQRGANAIHRVGFHAFPALLPEAVRVVVQRAPVLFGIGIVENACHQICHLEGIPAEAILEREPELLQLARERMGRLLIPEFDLLIVDEIGKDISGDGMDPNVTGRSAVMGMVPPPSIQKIVVLRLTAASCGNAVGLGMADITTQSLVNQIDFGQTYANAATSTIFTGVRIPVVMPDDHTAVALALTSLTGRSPEEATVVRIRNTLTLSEIEVSETLWRRIRGSPDFTPIAQPHPLTL